MVFLGVLVTGYLLSSDSLVRSEQSVTADINNGVCGDRRTDPKVHFLQKVKPSALQPHRPILEALADRYEDKYASFIKVVKDVAEKTRKKRSGQAHIASAKVVKLLERMRGFEKCRGFEARIHLARNELFLKDGAPTAGIEDKDEKFAKRLQSALSEGDECCQEDCDKAGAADGQCTPCTAVCGDGGCFTPPEWCFEKCKDGCDQNEGPCDCSDGKCRVCKGLSSLARYAAKELKVTLSFDVCPELEGRFEGSKPREVWQRQYCGMFDPRKECSVRLDHLLLRGDSLVKWSDGQAFAQSFPGCAPDLRDVPGAGGQGTAVLAWAKERVEAGQEDGDEGTFHGW